MSSYDFHSVFSLVEGRLFWKAPPPNHAEKAGREAGFVCIGKGKNKTYWPVRVFGRTFKRSRVVFFMVHGRWPTPSVDHINGDSLDDDPSNLRECTLSQNGANSRDRKRSCGLPRGVYRTRQGRFMARLRGESLGTFDTPEAAAVVFTAARGEAYGEFA